MRQILLLAAVLTNSQALLAQCAAEAKIKGVEDAGISRSQHHYTLNLAISRDCPRAATVTVTVDYGYRANNRDIPGGSERSAIKTFTFKSADPNPMEVQAPIDLAANELLGAGVHIRKLTASK